MRLEGLTTLKTISRSTKPWWCGQPRHPLPQSIPKITLSTCNLPLTHPPAHSDPVSGCLRMQLYPTNHCSPHAQLVPSALSRDSDQTPALLWVLNLLTVQSCGRVGHPDASREASLFRNRITALGSSTAQHSFPRTKTGFLDSQILGSSSQGMS